MTDVKSAAGVPAETPRPDPLSEVWLMIEMGWDIESREWFEKEAPKMGFKHPLSMAVHHMHKRCVKENPDFLRVGVPPAAQPPQFTWRCHGCRQVWHQQDRPTEKYCFDHEHDVYVSIHPVAPPAAKETPRDEEDAEMFRKGYEWGRNGNAVHEIAPVREGLDAGDVVTIVEHRRESKTKSPVAANRENT